MIRTVLRTGAAAVAVAAALALAGCGDGDGDGDGDVAETPATQSGDADTDRSGPAEVPDVTLLILETAFGNLARSGFEVEVVDASGEPVDVDDATAYQVVEQDPTEGPLPEGSVVTLTVEER